MDNGETTTGPHAPALSVLDHGPVSSGAPLSAALTHSTELARLAERAGYRRYWVAEHHSRAWMASSSPAVLLAHVAAATSAIRVGSGALLLSNYSPLAVAEQFGMLEALHPGRIDLGLGRAAGADAVTAHALNPARIDFGEAFGQLLGFFHGTFPEDHPYRSVTAVPGYANVPLIHLLGSGTYSARLAGQLGLPFAHGGHFAAPNTAAAIEAYRSSFQPSAVLDAPYVMLSVGVVCAPTDDEAYAINKLARHNMIRGLSGVNEPFLSQGEIDRAGEQAAMSLGEAHYVDSVLDTHIVGGPDTVATGLTNLAASTGADELILATIIYGYEERLRSYALVAEAMGLDGTSERQPPAIADGHQVQVG
ncbi:LLM class flavin-dependent oxidoreductase [Amycolatopsis echigonensis]|uniref:LLM class flavin-dependent oxidoreductase n=1 Tax=Amycolatopsis echigonensis TaxID=2576905 RepID=A0A8E1W6B9_9PSEU|nr:LLM class flavin-dependent oxidoreductase [Amycolatopsis echigonensis]MBB2505134.1 LLM class flavin-dependent oxidoreductase [Amycolatopsis echigonensis]